jgi:hypothetical protein
VNGVENSTLRSKSSRSLELVSGLRSQIGPVVVARREHRRRVERVEHRLGVGVQAVGARAAARLEIAVVGGERQRWRFMSAIRLGTPTVFCSAL